MRKIREELDSPSRETISGHDRFSEAEDTLEAIRRGEVDALVVSGPAGQSVYTLKGSEEPYRVIVESMVEGALIVAPDGLILYANAGFANLFQTPLEDVIGTNVCEFVFPDDVEKVRHHCKNALVERASPIEVVCNCCDGRRLVVLLSTRHLRLDEMDVACLILTDMSEVAAAREARLRQEAERTEILEGANRRLRELDRLKSEFLALMSHELRTPLNAILGFSELIMDGASGEVTAEQVRQLKFIHQAGANLLRIITDLLDVSRIEAGKMNVLPDVIQLDELVADIVQRCQPQARTKGLQLRFVNDGPAVQLESDPRKIVQILLNLLTNAIKFTDCGSVELRIEPQDEAVRLVVSDTGIGIEADELGRIFDPFHQALGPLTRRQHEGTGLGLYLSRKLAELLGGSIDVHSTPGQGSTFAVTLPFKPEIGPS